MACNRSHSGKPALRRPSSQWSYMPRLADDLVGDRAERGARSRRKIAIELPPRLVELSKLTVRSRKHTRDPERLRLHAPEREDRLTRPSVQKLNSSYSAFLTSWPTGSPTSRKEKYIENASTNSR